MGTVASFIHRRIQHCSVSLSPVNGKHLRCGWVKMPLALNPGTVGVVPFKDAQNYIPISLRQPGDGEEDIGEMWDKCSNNVLFILLI